MKSNPKLFKPKFYKITMVKGMYHYIKEAWKKPDAKTLRERMTEWRKAEVFTILDKPLRLDKARALGYKDKKGFVVVRIRVPRGGHRKTRPNAGRKGARLTPRLTLKMNYKWVAESRVQKKYQNLEVLNSYQIGRDGQNYFFEVICADPSKPEIQNDSTINWICKGSNKGRVLRGLTSAGKKSRGLRSKSPTSKVRPSVRAGHRKGK